jgi:spore germination protein KB
MPETPMIALLIMFIFVCAWAVRAGVETMVRYSWLFVVVSFIVIIFILLLLMKEMKLDNLLPMFTLPPLKYVQGTHIVAAIPFGEILVFMMMAPFLDNQQKIAKSFLWGFLIGAVTLLTIVVRDVVTLGNLISYATLPSYEVVKLIDVFDILTRMEVLYAIELLILLFFKVSILYFATVLALFQVLRLRCYKPYIFITGVIILSLSMIVFRSPMENAYWGSTAAPAFSSIFQLVIPGAALLTSVLRDMLQKDKDKVERT